MFLSAVALAVLQRPRSHRLAEHAAEMGGRGKASLLGHSADVQVSALQQALGSLDAAAIDVIHNGLARDPPEQPAQVIGRQIEPCSHICQGELLLVVGRKVSADLLHRLVAGADVLPFTAALLLHIVQDEGQIDHAGAFRLAFGALHHAQQSAQAARPLHRAVQGRLCSRLKQRHEIPLHQVLEHRENARREPAADELRGNVARLLQQAGHIAPELIGCRFPAGVLPVLKNLMQRDFMPLFEPGAQTALYGPVQWSGRLRTLLGMMQSAESEPESPGMIYLALILHYVEQERRSERQDIRPRNETVEQICAYLAANYQQKFSLTDVAARFYLSPYYLSRLFRRVTGQSIVDYINGRRIEAAQRLLESTDLNISAVAEQTGFASAAHFRRVFRETMGTGPLQYRKSHRG